MATIYKPSAGLPYAAFNPISSTLNNLPAGAGSIAALVAKDSGAGNIDCCGLTNVGATAWYHTIGVLSNALMDDNQIGGGPETPTWSPTTNWYIVGVSWAAGTVTERYHHVNQTSPAGWTHANATTTNGGNRAGPGTSAGFWRIGEYGDFSDPFGIALSAAWVGVALSDAQFAELSVNNRTSDWWNNSGGQPTLLVECTSLTMTDIGANPSTFEANHGLTVQNPTGGAVTWNFDGHGAAAGASQLDFHHVPGAGLW